MAKKESRGRQKIKMAKIKNSSHRQVTFSKRRLGLFKKASEICTLCGVEAVIIVFSPGQKIFSFGQPDVESLVDRFLSRNQYPQVSNNAPKLKGAQYNARMCELNSQLTHILDLLEIEKNRGEEFTKLSKSSPSQWWWEAPIDKLDLHELEVLSVSMEDLKKSIANQATFLEKNTSLSMLDMNGDAVVSEHFNLKSFEAKMNGFCFPQVDIFGAPKIF